MGSVSQAVTDLTFEGIRIADSGVLRTDHGSGLFEWHVDARLTQELPLAPDGSSALEGILSMRETNGTNLTGTVIVQRVRESTRSLGHGGSLYDLWVRFKGSGDLSGIS